MKDSKVCPGGSPRPAMKMRGGKTVRGDGKGRPLKSPAQSTGQDLMRGEGSKSFKNQSRQTALQKTGNSNLTWVKGDRQNLDDTSLKNLEATVTGTSMFDPVLCELVYRWFCPPGGKILDPFAGGSVRGIVAGKLGYDYVGVELRGEQVDANLKQSDAILEDCKPGYIVGDSQYIGELAKGEYDLIFSCPPYYDLEVYSDGKGELSAMPSYEDFVKVYRIIIAKCVAMLNDNRFACFVVGDIRDTKGFYRNFVSDTISAFLDAGMLLYNEAILVTAVGSLPIRVGRAFQANRKLGKTHQNVLIFFKGDIKHIREFGEVEVGDTGEIDAHTPKTL